MAFGGGGGYRQRCRRCGLIAVEKVTAAVVVFLDAGLHRITTEREFVVVLEGQRARLHLAAQFHRQAAGACMRRPDVRTPAPYGRTYTKSFGSPLMPLSGGAIQLAIFPAS